MATTASVTPCKHGGAASVASRRRCRVVCAVVSMAALLLTAVVAVLVLRQRPAVATLEALRLTSLSLSLIGAGASLNATLDADLAIRNPSPVASFAHDAGHAEVYYRGALAADVDLPAGRVAGGGTEQVTVRLVVLADRLAVRAPQLYHDIVASGDVPLTLRTAVPGTATVLGVLRHHVVVVTECDVAVTVRAAAVQTSSCRYRTKL